MDSSLTPGTAGQRGRPGGAIRDQIIAAASEHFSLFGYEKTTVSDLAKAIGFSKAYIYKFFDSKQSIGSAICAQVLSRIQAVVEASMAEADSATERMRTLARTLVRETARLLFDERKLYDIAAHSTLEKWNSSLDHQAHVLDLIKTVLREGRESGEFERKTPLDETARSIALVFQPFTNPLMLQHNLDMLPDGVNEVTSLVLRSLAP